jgi:phytoene desaturase
VTKPRIVVVGAGLGGLAVALRLAAAGAGKITVCERGERPGGKLNLLEREGFRFDTGPSLITLPGVFAELFAAAGEELSKHLTLRRLDPHAEYVYPHGTRFALSPNLPAWLATLGQLDKGEPEAFLELLALGARIYGVSEPSFLTRPVTAPPDRAVFKALRRFPLRGAWGNYARTVESIAKSPELRQLYLRYPTYVGSSPWACPATLLVIPYLEYAFGAWAVDGGLYRIAEVLLELLAERGVEVRTHAEVTGIERQGGRVSGVALQSGERLAAEIVVTNADAAQLPRLLGEGDGGLAEADRSLSGLVFLLGVKRDLPQLAHHTVYFSADYRREFDELFARREFPDDPTVYVNAASRSDRSVVPGGVGETLFIMANAPAEPGRWGDRKSVV